MRIQRDLAIGLTVAATFIASTMVAYAQTPTASPNWQFGLAAQIFGGVAVAIVIAAIVILFLTSSTPGESFIYRMRPTFFFWLGITYTLLLLLGAIVYNISYTGTQPYLIGGVMPVAVPWFGALGAVTISLEGVFTWSESRWNPDYNYWHCGRPVFGAVLGAVSFYLFVLIVMTAGTTPSFLGPVGTGQPLSPATPSKDFIVYYVVAFLVGYREETFRELIRRVTDLILKPGTQAATSAQITFKEGDDVKSEIKFADTAANAQAKVTIEILNSGGASLSNPVVTVKELDAASKDVFKITKNDATGRSDLKSNESSTVEITFTPTKAGKYSAVLSVAGANLAMPATITIAGSATG